MADKMLSIVLGPVRIIMYTTCRLYKRECLFYWWSATDLVLRTRSTCDTIIPLCPQHTQTWAHVTPAHPNKRASASTKTPQTRAAHVGEYPRAVCDCVPSLVPRSRHTPGENKRERVWGRLEMLVSRVHGNYWIIDAGRPAENLMARMAFANAIRI